MMKLRLCHIALAGLASAVFMTASCSLDKPSYYTKSGIELHETFYQSSFAVSQMDHGALQDMAQAYYHAGEGGMDVTVTYNPKSRTDTARNATEKAAEIAQTLQDNGVTHVRTDILPIVDSVASEAHISFMYVEARVPENCGRMDDIDDTGMEIFRDYGLGCTTDRFIARQVASPRDLLGRAVPQDSIGRRESTVVSGHKSGEQRPVLQGESTGAD